MGTDWGDERDRAVVRLRERLRPETLDAVLEEYRREHYGRRGGTPGGRTRADAEALCDAMTAVEDELEMVDVMAWRGGLGGKGEPSNRLPPGTDGQPPGPLDFPTSNYGGRRDRHIDRWELREVRRALEVKLWP